MQQGGIIGINDAQPSNNCSGESWQGNIMFIGTIYPEIYTAQLHDTELKAEVSSDPLIGNNMF